MRNFVLIEKDGENKVIATILSNTSKMEVIQQKVINAIQDHFAVTDVKLDFDLEDMVMSLDHVNFVEVSFTAEGEPYSLQIEPAWVY